jgi:hypothetical protein
MGTESTNDLAEKMLAMIRAPERKTNTNKMISESTMYVIRVCREKEVHIKLVTCRGSQKSF